MVVVCTPSMRNVDDVLRALHSERCTFAAANVMDRAAKTIREQRNKLEPRRRCSECRGAGKIARYSSDYGSYSYECPVCGGSGEVGELTGSEGSNENLSVLLAETRHDLKATEKERFQAVSEMQRLAADNERLQRDLFAVARWMRDEKLTDAEKVSIVANHPSIKSICIS